MHANLYGVPPSEQRSRRSFPYQWWTRSNMVTGRIEFLCPHTQNHGGLGMSPRCVGRIYLTSLVFGRMEILKK